jgi:hypothetical protein
MSHPNIKLTEDFLLKQCEIINLYYDRFPKKIKNSNCYIVIVEPRSDHILLEAVCKNVMYFLPDNWNLVVYSYDESMVRNRIKNIEFIFKKTTKSSFTLEEYSNLLMSHSFWDNIPGEDIIIFQTDSYITKRITNEYLNRIRHYPFIGAVYRVINGKDNIDLVAVDRTRNFSMSGGFSFRSKSAMKDCISKITLDNIMEYRIKNNLNIDFKNKYYEDFYFENALYILNYKLPTYDECISFCVQVYYKLINSYAIHGIYRYYVYDSLIYNLRPSLAEIHEEILNKLN